MRNIIISVLATLLLLTQGMSAESLSAKRFDPQAKQKAQSAFEQAKIYTKQNKYIKALKYLKLSYEYEPADGTAFNLGVVYEKLKNYDKAIQWYKQAFKMGKIDGGANLGFMYDEKLKDYPNAIKWYKKAIKKGDIDSRKNLGLLYHELGDDLHSAVYMMGMIGHPYTKERVMGLLRNTWKIDEPTLKKAYELQKKLVPDPYTGGID